MPDHPTPAAARTTSPAEPLAAPEPAGSWKPKATADVRDTLGARRAIGGIGWIGWIGALAFLFVGAVGASPPPAAPIALASLQPLLDEETALFDYVLENDRSYLWVVTRHDSQVFPLAGKRAIDTAAARLLELSTMTSSAAQLAWGQAAAALSDLVLQPAAAALRLRRRLIFVADGELLAVPFASLPEPGTDGAPTKSTLVRPELLDAHEVSSTPSIVALEALHKRSVSHERQRHISGPRRPRRVTVIADPLYSAADPRLHDRGASAAHPDFSFIRRHHFLAGYGAGRRPRTPPGRKALHPIAHQRPPITNGSVAGATLTPTAGERVVTLRGGQPQGWLTANSLRTRARWPAGPPQGLAASRSQWLFRLIAGDTDPLRCLAAGRAQRRRHLVVRLAESLRHLAAAGGAPWLQGLAASCTEPFPRLAASQEEALSILDMSPDGGTVALGAAASRDFILQGGLRDASTIHFAAHSTINWLYPPQSGLVLSQFDAAGRPANGLLTTADIGGLRLQADLVTLGSCSSARGALPAGAGLASPSGAFLAAGARCVLASLWNAEDHSTAELMRRFYDGVLRQGLTAPEALRRAQAALRADPRWHAPYYWAGFVLDGDCVGAGRAATMNR